MRALLVALILFAAVAMQSAVPAADACFVQVNRPPAKGMESGPDCRYYFVDGQRWISQGGFSSHSRTPYDTVSGTAIPLPSAALNTTFYTMIAGSSAVLALWAISPKRRSSES